MLFENALFVGEIPRTAPASPAWATDPTLPFGSDYSSEIFLSHSGMKNRCFAYNRKAMHAYHLVYQLTGEFGNSPQRKFRFQFRW